VNVNASTPRLSGAAAMVLTAQGDLASGSAQCRVLSAMTSTAGAVAVNGIIDAFDGRHAHHGRRTDVTLNQAIRQTGRRIGAGRVTAGRDRSRRTRSSMAVAGLPGGAVALSAGRNLAVNDYVLTNNGTIDLTATSGAATVAAGKGTFLRQRGSDAGAPSGDLTTGAVAADR
jgi:hypothetical protein